MIITCVCVCVSCCMVTADIDRSVNYLQLINNEPVFFRRSFQQLLSECLPPPYDVTPTVNHPPINKLLVAVSVSVPRLMNRGFSSVWVFCQGPPRTYKNPAVSQMYLSFSRLVWVRVLHSWSRFLVVPLGSGFVFQGSLWSINVGLFHFLQGSLGLLGLSQVGLAGFFRAHRRAVTGWLV